jgi:hypothetical protein
MQSTDRAGLSRQRLVILNEGRRYANFSEGPAIIGFEKITSRIAKLLIMECLS